MAIATMVLGGTVGFIVAALCCTVGRAEEERRRNSNLER